MSRAKTYLASYNAALVAGWSYVLILAFAALRTAGPSAVYAAVARPLALAPLLCRSRARHTFSSTPRASLCVTARSHASPSAPLDASPLVLESSACAHLMVPSRSRK